MYVHADRNFGAYPRFVIVGGTIVRIDFFAAMFCSTLGGVLISD